MTPAVMAGQGVGGICASAVDIISKLSFESLSDAVCMYFIIAIIFMGISGQFQVHRHYFYCYLANVYLHMQQKVFYQYRLAGNDITVADELKLKDGEEMRSMDPESLVIYFETASQAIRRAVWPYHLTLVLTFTVTFCKFYIPHLFLI